MQNQILFETRNHIGFVTLNRPAALNALTLSMVVDMHEQLWEWAHAPSIHAVVVKGAGDKAFCAGGDVRALYDSLAVSGHVHNAFPIAEYRLDHFVHGYPKPYVALMDGIVMGGGMGIAQGASLRVVTDRTRMAMPEAGIGMFPDVGASYFLSRVPGSVGRYLGVTGVHMNAGDALYCRLADVCLPHAALGKLESTLASMRWSEDHFADIRNAVQPLAMKRRPDTSLVALRWAIDVHFSCTDIAAVMASLKAEPRPGYGAWARETLALMATRSPLMMAVAARQLQRGGELDLADCFRMELGMARHCVVQPDFKEGVRAVLVDKDKAARWSPARIEDVTEEMIERFFVSPWIASAHPFVALEAENTVDPARAAAVVPAKVRHAY